MMKRSYKHVYNTAPNSFVCNRLQPSYKRIFDLLGIKDGAQKMKLVKMMAECTAMFACAFMRPCATALLCRSSSAQCKLHREYLRWMCL